MATTTTKNEGSVRHDARRESVLPEKNNVSWIIWYFSDTDMNESRTNMFKKVYSPHVCDVTPAAFCPRPLQRPVFALARVAGNKCTRCGGAPEQRTWSRTTVPVYLCMES